MAMVTGSALVALGEVLAVPPATNNFGDTRTGGLAGPVGLLLVVLMALATVLLIRNMNARLRRLPREFPDRPAGERDNRVDAG